MADYLILVRTQTTQVVKQTGKSRSRRDPKYMNKGETRTGGAGRIKQKVQTRTEAQKRD